MSDKIKQKWTVAAILVGWAITIGGLVHAAIEDEALSDEYIRQNQQNIADHESRIRTVEEDRQRIAEVARDVEWIKQFLQSRGQ